jgi:hypothetical protein
MPRRWTPASFLTLAVAAFLVVQLAVPTVALFGPRPARFAWQMYSALPPVPEASVVWADGHEEPVDLSSLFAVQRAEIDYAAVLRAGLCGATGAAAVRIKLSDGGIEEIACR